MESLFIKLSYVVHILRHAYDWFCGPQKNINDMNKQYELINCIDTFNEQMHLIIYRTFFKHRNFFLWEEIKKSKIMFHRHSAQEIYLDK